MNRKFESGSISVVKFEETKEAIVMALMSSDEEELIDGVRHFVGKKLTWRAGFIDSDFDILDRSTQKHLMQRQDEMRLPRVSSMESTKRSTRKRPNATELQKFLS